MESKFKSLNIYKAAMELGDLTWNIVNAWDQFDKRSIGLQVIRSIDSMAANIAEGYGRGSAKDQRKFCYYSRGSAMESQAWIQKAFERGLVSNTEYELLDRKLNAFSKMLNGYINYLNRKI